MSNKSSKRLYRRTLPKTALWPLALFMSATLWFYVVNSEPIELEKRLPLTFIIPDEMAIANIVDSTVLISFRGSRAFMQNVVDLDEVVEISLVGHDQGDDNTITANIYPSDLPIPFGVEVIDIYPKEIEIVLEQRETKTIEVRPQLIGDLPDQLNLVHSSLEPNAVVISGPQSMLRGLERIRTNSIDLSNFRNSGVVQVRPRLPDVRLELKHDDVLDFKYEVRPGQANLTFSRVPVTFMGIFQEFSSQIRYVDVSVLARESEVEEIDIADIEVIAKIPANAQGRTLIDLEANLPAGIFLMEINPSFIEVQVLDN